MKIEELIGGGIAVGLFIFCIVMAGTQIAQQNDMNSSISQDKEVDEAFNNLSDTFNHSASTMEKIKADFISEPTKLNIITLPFLILTSVFAAGKGFVDLILGIFNTFIILISRSLGLSPVITGGILTLIIITIILAIWRIYKGSD